MAVKSKVGLVKDLCLGKFPKTRQGNSSEHTKLSAHLRVMVRRKHTEVKVDKYL